MKKPVGTSIAIVAGLFLLAIFGGREPESPTKPVTTQSQSQGALIDINQASAAELMALKGIGKARAEDIIKGRPYARKDELVQKKILPQSVYDSVRDQIIARQK